MKRINNKGFAISTMLYGLLIIIVLIIAMILNIMAFNRKNSKEFSETVVDELENKETYSYTNQNIKAAYTYNASTCVTGEKSTCKQISITRDTNVLPGTIIQYAVNDTEIVTFHVISDSGSELTMQSQKNIGENKMWINTSDYAAKNNQASCSSTFSQCTDKGPVTALNALSDKLYEKSGNTTKLVWTNVKTIPQGMGNGYSISTGCSSPTICNSNMYMVFLTIAARMITVQEAANLGCTGAKNSCPKWMYSSNVTGGYWTMQAYSGSQIDAWYITSNGSLETNSIISGKALNVHAVVVIDK